jgi:hypothetical protein
MDTLEEAVAGSDDRRRGKVGQRVGGGPQRGSATVLGPQGEGRLTGWLLHSGV